MKTKKRYICWCGKPALPEYVLFTTTDYDAEGNEYENLYGFCEEHQNQWRVKHPFIYVDGIGTTMLNYLNEASDKATKTTAGWVKYVSYYPCVFTGSGTYSDKQTEAVNTMLREYREIAEQAHKNRQPLFVVNNPFTQILASPLFIEHPQRLRLALKYLYRPAVWMLVNSSPMAVSAVHDVIRLSNKCTPLTYVYFTEGFELSRRGAWSYWNSAITLFINQGRQRRTNRGVNAHNKDERV